MVMTDCPSILIPDMDTTTGTASCHTTRDSKAIQLLLYNILYPFVFIIHIFIQSSISFISTIIS